MVAVETVRAVAVYQRTDHFIDSLLLTHFPTQAPGREEAEVGGSLTWATMARAGGYTWCLGSPFEPVPQSPSPTLCLEGFTSMYKPWRPFDNLRSQSRKPVWPIYAKNVSFLKAEGLYFHRAHLRTESLIYESATCSENVPFLWTKPQLSTNSANTLTSFCKHFHVIQSLTSFVSTRVKLLGKITLFPLKNHFLFKQFPRYSTPPTSSWSWLTLLGQVRWPEHRQSSVPGQVGAGEMRSVQILTKTIIA